MTDKLPSINANNGFLNLTANVSFFKFVGNPAVAQSIVAGTGDFELLGGRFNMPRIAEEVLRVEAGLRHMDANGGRLPQAAGAQ